jgi:hypothetical protein
MLSTIANATKFVQNCQILPNFSTKTISLKNFEIPPNFLVFFIILSFVYRGDVKACVYYFNFHYKQVSFAFVIV